MSGNIIRPPCFFLRLYHRLQYGRLEQIIQVERKVTHPFTPTSRRTAFRDTTSRRPSSNSISTLFIFPRATTRHGRLYSVIRFSLFRQA